jgi:hypothetical protein
MGGTMMLVQMQQNGARAAKWLRGREIMIRPPCYIKQLLSISLFVLGIFFSNAAQAQSCTPAVYLFRHAEDQNGFPSMLTSIGKTHAKLYPMMINQLRTTFGLCPVQRVFAMWDRNRKGTDNPYDTAFPLAQAVGAMLDPPVDYKPEMFFTDSDNNKY